MINKRDEKQRPEVGTQDIDKYEFGGLEVDETLTNGYHLYIPYGIHCDIFKTIQYSIQLLYKECYDIENDLAKIKAGVGNTITEEAYNGLKENLEQKLTLNKQRIALFEKIEPLINEI